MTPVGHDGNIAESLNQEQYSILVCFPSNFMAFSPFFLRVVNQRPWKEAAMVGGQLGHVYPGVPRLYNTTRPPGPKPIVVKVQKKMFLGSRSSEALYASFVDERR